MRNQLRKFIAAIFLMSTLTVQAEDTIKVGILHSLSGTMAISETTLKDAVLMLIKDLNKQGGLLGKKVEPAWIMAKVMQCMVL